MYSHRERLCVCCSSDAVRLIGSIIAMAKESPKKLESLLKKVMKDLGKKGKLTEEVMAEIWKEAVGENASKHTKPKSIKKGTLFITVDDSSWMYDLTLKKRDIVSSLDGKLKGRKVKDIRFRIGVIKDNKGKE